MGYLPLGINTTLALTTLKSFIIASGIYVKLTTYRWQSEVLMELIGRAEEVALLRDCHNSGKPEFIAVYGRRRVGKTFLIKETLGGDFAFYATGVIGAKRAAALKTFANALVDHGAPAQPIRDWFDAFRCLRDHLAGIITRRPGRRTIVFLDELPWFDSHKSDFVPALDHFWNSWASEHSEVMLIVCGSAASWIVNKLFEDRAGLHNRITRRIALQPLSLAECKALFAAQQVVLSDEQIIEANMVFGGIPYYLSLFSSRLSLAQNVNRLCFAEGAELADEFDTLYHSLFTQADNHVAIIRTLGRKKKGMLRQEIAAGAGIADGGTLTKVLRELELSGFIRSYRPFGRTKRGKLYQLIDPFTLFHLNFMADGKNDDELYWLKILESSRHHAWTGYAFEMVCLRHLHEIKEALQIGGVVVAASTWRSEDSDPGAQIDLVLDRSDATINLCEIKYASGSPYEITKDYDQALRRKRSAFMAETKTRKAVITTLITPHGLARNAYAGNIPSEITAADLF